MALGFRNLAAVAAGYRSAGAARLVLVDIVETRAQVADYERSIPGAVVTVVGLAASLPTIRERLTSRESGADLVWHQRRAAELAEQWRRDPVADLEVDTDGRTPVEVAGDILARLGWLRL
jgi:chloramphenicol 3-O-phosphotransferase